MNTLLSLIWQQFGDNSVGIALQFAGMLSSELYERELLIVSQKRNVVNCRLKDV